MVAQTFTSHWVTAATEHFALFLNVPTFCGKLHTRLIYFKTSIERVTEKLKPLYHKFSLNVRWLFKWKLNLGIGLFMFALEEVWQIIVVNHWCIIKKNNMASPALVIPAPCGLI